MRRVGVGLCAALVLLTVPAAGAQPEPPPGPKYEITYPTGAHAGERPAGWVVLIHGGGWNLPPQAMGFEAPARDRFNRWGWATLNVGYRPDRLSLTDSLALYDWLRRRVGERVPVCTEGGSAGGHLALMVAARRRTVSCVIALAPPTDFVTVPNPLTPLATRTFGSSLRLWSPALLEFSAPTVAACATNDPVVRCDQVDSLVHRHPAAHGVYLDPGATFFVHSGVDGAQLKTFWRRARALLAGTTNRS